MPTSRRQVLRQAGLLAAGAVGAAGSAVAAPPTYPHQPDHVTLTFDEAALETYRPRFVISHLDVDVTRVYGWVASSPEYDTDVYCYWVYYTRQVGVSDADSHTPDREPVYVEVDSQTGEIATVHKDVYHYLNGPTSGDATPLDDTHPKLRIIEPWHPYEVTPTEGVLLDVASMHTVYDEWLDLGWTVYEPVVVAPWRIAHRNHWWPPNALGFTLKNDYWRAIYNTLGRTDLPGRDT